MGDWNKKFGTLRKPLSISHPSATLTAVLIVKNEAGNIADAVESIQQVADEILINDTGSSDGTQELLDKLGVKWFQSEWKEDFSLARNQCLERATCAWIFWMDADDRASLEVRNRLLKLKRSVPDSIYGFEVVNSNKTGGLGARFLQVRLFPNHPGLRFRYRVHEQIEPAAADLGLHCRYFAEPIYHLGYADRETRIKKAKRNLEWILSETKRLEEDPAFGCSLGDCYYLMNQWEKGIQAFQRVRDMPQAGQVNWEAFTEAATSIGLGLMKLKRWEEAKKWLQLAHQEKPEKLESLYYLALIAEETKTEGKALGYYEAVIQMKKPLTGTVNRHDAIRMKSLFRLAEMNLEGERFSKADQYIGMLQEEYPTLVEPWHLQGLLHRKKKQHLKALQAWVKGLSLNPAVYWPIHRDLLILLREMGNTDLLVGSIHLAKKHFPTETGELLGMP